MRAFAIFLWIAVLPAAPAFADAWVPEPLHYARVALDENDRSYFADVSESFEMKDFAPPAGPDSTSRTGKAAADSTDMRPPPEWIR